MLVPDIVNNIFSITPATFMECALQMFRYQYSANPVYRQWVDAIGVKPATVTTLEQIPFLPISFFKSDEVFSGDFKPEVIFTSSGTTQSINSRHLVKDVELYRQSFIDGLRRFYGDVTDWCIIGLLPSYLEREGSSLVMMVEELVKLSGKKESGFYLYNFEALHQLLQKLEGQKQKTLLIGVTFALLDFASQYPIHLEYTTVMETGGMKGRRREMIRQEVHEVLQQGLGMKSIHSEYGMTELLSQAYSPGNGIFTPVPWMKILVRDEDDPLQVKQQGRGVINVIDLANIHSCSFIATDDAGMLYPDGRFEVLGRIDSSDIRGCSLMVV